MPILNVYVDDKTHERLEWYARENEGWTVETLAEAAVEEAALKADTRGGHDAG